MDVTMPTPPPGFHWRAEDAASDGWLVLHLEEIDETKRGGMGPDFPEHERMIVGLCGAEPQYVESMAGLLLERYAAWRPVAVATRSLIDAINGGEQG